MTTDEKRKWLCQRCGNCCRWPGIVRVTESEITTIAAYLDIPEGQFYDEYTAVTPDRTGLTLISNADHSCIFLEGKNNCRINSVKPIQCGGFPNTWTVENWQDKCEAISVPEADFDNLAKLRDLRMASEET